MVFEIIEISLFLRVYFWLNIGFTDFEKHVKTSKFHRIFGLYRLLSDFRITDINFVNFEKLDRTLSIISTFVRFPKGTIIDKVLISTFVRSPKGKIIDKVLNIYRITDINFCPISERYDYRPSSVEVLTKNIC